MLLKAQLLDHLLPDCLLEMKEIPIVVNTGELVFPELIIAHSKSEVNEFTSKQKLANGVNCASTCIYKTSGFTDIKK